MKILIWSDLHAYPHLGYEMFIDTAITFLQYLKDYANKHKIDTIFFLGDMFQIKTKVNSIDYIRVREILKEYRDQFKLYFLIGNHDKPKEDSTDGSIMWSFDEYGQVVADYSHYDIDDIRFHFASYRKNNIMPAFELNKKNVLLMHQDMRGFKMNNFHESETGLEISYFKMMDLVFSGHYHLHQIRGNLIYVGSGFQTSFGERDTKKGFVILDTKTLEWKFIQYKKAPRFKYVAYKNRSKAHIENCFVKVLIPPNIKNTLPIKEELRKKGAISVDFTTVTEELIQELQFVEDINKENIKELALQFLENIDIPEELSRKKLLAILDNIDEKYFTQKG